MVVPGRFGNPNYLPLGCTAHTASSPKPKSSLHAQAPSNVVVPGRFDNLEDLPRGCSAHSVCPKPSLICNPRRRCQTWSSQGALTTRGTCRAAAAHTASALNPNRPVPAQALSNVVVPGRFDNLGDLPRGCSAHSVCPEPQVMCDLRRRCRM